MLVQFNPSHDLSPVAGPEFSMPHAVPMLELPVSSVCERSLSTSASASSLEPEPHTLKRQQQDDLIGSPPKRRMRAKPDGRCQIRASLHAACAPLPEGISCILDDDSLAAREFIKQTRMAAAQKVKEEVDADETLAMIVGCDFPDELYDSFDEWIEAMGTDDTQADSSTLWHGGGQWLLYGLGKLLNVTVEVTSLYPDLVSGSGFFAGGTLDVVQAGDRTIHLAMLHDDDGAPDHFDVLMPVDPGSP
jgi:hypothetical protein